MHLTGDEMGTDHNIQLREPVFEDGSDLREEFKQLSLMRSLWTRSFFVSTAGNVSSETIKKYVENQKKKYV